MENTELTANESAILRYLSDGREANAITITEALEIKCRRQGNEFQALLAAGLIEWIHRWQNPETGEGGGGWVITDAGLVAVYRPVTF